MANVVWCVKDLPGQIRETFCMVASCLVNREPSLSAWLALKSSSITISAELIYCRTESAAIWTWPISRSVSVLPLRGYKGTNRHEDGFNYLCTASLPVKASRCREEIFSLIDILYTSSPLTQNSVLICTLVR